MSRFKFMRDSKDYITWLNDIVESAELVSLYMEGVTEGIFFESTEKQVLEILTSSK